MSPMFRAVAALVLLATPALAGEIRTTLALSGLTCAACPPAVTKALRQVEGVRAVRITDDRTQAAVVADERVRPEALAEAVRRLGYGAEVVTPQMETCCGVDGAGGRAGCPSCGQHGRPVSRTTVCALARLEVEAPRLAAKHYRFCEAPTCPVVYFAPEGVRMERDDVRVAVHQKDTGPGVPLCYCFGYTRARLVGEGKAAVAFVGAEVKARRCACDVKNPSGRCCLGDLRRFLRAMPVDQSEETP